MGGMLFLALLMHLVAVPLYIPIIMPQVDPAVHVVSTIGLLSIIALISPILGMAMALAGIIVNGLFILSYAIDIAGLVAPFLALLEIAMVVSCYVKSVLNRIER